MSVFKILRMEEVKRHNDAESTWVVIHDSVYDLTDYLNEHPGGPEVLLDEAGKNATEAFDDVGHSSDAKSMMIKYKIGELHEDDIVQIRPNAQSSGNRWKMCSLAVAVGLAVTAVVSVYKFFRLRR